MTPAKDELRRRLRTARRGLSAAERLAQAEAACAVLWPLVAQAPALASYAALADELDLEPLHRRWWAAGRPLWLPRVAGPGRLAWHPVPGPGGLTAGAYGIREPDPARHPAAPLPATAVILVPGVGFGADGRRLGQGGGFYDRVLPAHPGPAIGVGFPCQRCDDLPEDPHDRRCRPVVLGGEILAEP